MLEPETDVAGVGSGLVLDDASGFQEGVDGVGMGVRDEGSQAGVVDEDQSGMGVALPKLEGAEHCDIQVSI